MHTDLITAFPGAQTFWTYEPSQPKLDIAWRRWKARFAREHPPRWEAVKVPASRRRWLVYFLYAADGQLQSWHRFTLERLSKEDASLLIICACPPGHPVLQELAPWCDAMYWKALNGWDFSAYAIALSELARSSPGADVLVLNDSVFGPLRPLVPFMEVARWRLTGFTANVGEENHLQSYAFIVKSIDPDFMLKMGRIFSTGWSYNAADPVILLQETLMAREAHRSMSVGAFFFTDGSSHTDLCLHFPGNLIDSGFPWLKRSLFGKFRGAFQDPVAMQVLFERLGLPPT